MAIVSAPADDSALDGNSPESGLVGPRDSLYLVQELQPLSPPPDDVSSGLASLYGPADSPTVCYRGPIPLWGLDLSTGEVTDSIDCRANTCPACRVWKVHYLSGRIYRTRPESFFTLTGLPASWSLAKGPLQSVFRWLRRHDFPCHAVYALERQPATPQLAHMHGYGSGWPPARLLSEAAERAGLGHRVDVRRVGRPGIRGFVYPWKTATWNGDAYVDFRALNGSRLYHATRGWLSSSSTTYGPPRRSSAG